MKNKSKAKENLHALLDMRGIIVTKAKEKSEVLNYLKTELSVLSLLSCVSEYEAIMLPSLSLWQWLSAIVTFYRTENKMILNL